MGRILVYYHSNAFQRNHSGSDLYFTGLIYNRAQLGYGAGLHIYEKECSL